MKIFVVILITILPLEIIAQESTNASGGDINESGKGSVSYSIGQIVYTQNTGSNGSLAQGVQQPYEISVVTGMEEKGISLELSVYPNPVTDYLNIILSDAVNKNLKYSFYSVEGELLTKGKINRSNTQIDITRFASTAFLLNVSDNQTRIKTFKIIKR